MSCCDQPGLMPLDQAMEQLLDSLSPITETEMVALPVARGRVLAEPLISPLSVPPCDNSSMDGYALHFGDLQAEPTRALTVIGKSFAGAPYQGEVNPGECVRIMTGAKLPDGADCVIMQEQAEQLADGTAVRFSAQPKLGQNIRRAGEDLMQGQDVYAAGTLLKAAHIGQLATLGVAEVKVSRRVKVALLATGDELRQPGEPLNDGDIFESNRTAMRPLLERLPVEIIDLGVIPDDRQALRDAFITADEQADLVLTSGGVSVGEADYTKDILEELGQVNFWKLAIKPGKPLAFGQLPHSQFIGLPGNPVSAVVTLHQVAARAIEKLSGTPPRKPLRIPAVTAEPLKKRPGRADFQRGIAELNHQGQISVRSTGAQGSGLLSSLSKANCYIVLEQERGRVEAGETVFIELFDELLS